MNRHRTRSGKQGFTLVELGAGALTAAVLAVTAGAMLFYGYMTWRRARLAVDLQRDGTAAVRMLTTRLREAGASDVAVSAGRVDVLSRGSAAALYASGSDLVFDPDTGTAGDEQTIVPGRLASFTPAMLDRGVALRFVLTSSEETTTINTFLSFRN
jgi:hypothetical protein